MVSRFLNTRLHYIQTTSTFSKSELVCYCPIGRSTAQCLPSLDLQIRTEACKRHLPRSRLKNHSISGKNLDAWGAGAYALTGTSYISLLERGHTLSYLERLHWLHCRKSDGVRYCAAHTRRRSHTLCAAEGVLVAEPEQIVGKEHEEVIVPSLLELGVAKDVEEWADVDLQTLHSMYKEMELAPCAEVVVGVDPDACGAVAILRRSASGLTAEVMDAPTIQVLVGATRRKRHDSASIAALVRGINAPLGSVAFVEQCGFLPGNGKQGFYSTGYGHGVWVGVLTALGFRVVAVPVSAWKRAMGVYGKQFTKDDSRALACRLFPYMKDQLKRKKDHGRAEALLIAAFGRGLHGS